MNNSEVITKIHQEYPDFVIEAIEFLEAGFDSEAFLINDSFVFKFSRHARAAANLYKEVTVLNEIRNQLPLKVPKIYFLGKSDPLDQFAFVGYERIMGVPLNKEILTTLSAEEKETLAKELSIFFKTLHTIELRTKLKGLEIDKKAKAAYEYQVIKEAAYPLLKRSVQREIDEVYQRILNQDFSYKKCLMHNDFGASNVYYDLKAKRISGVIDFGDVAIYDRDMEFICLLYDYEDGFDQTFVKKILTYYGISKKTLIDKTRFVAFYNQLENIYLGKEFEMYDLFKEGVNNIQNGLDRYDENILFEDKTKYYI